MPATRSPQTPAVPEAESSAQTADPPRYVLTLSDDLMEARLGFAAPIERLSQRELEDELGAEHGLVALDHEAVASAVEAARHEPVQDVVIARGIAPRPGVDARIEWLGEFFQSRAVQYPNGQVDHYHHGRLSAYPGQPMLEVIAATAGVAGSDVRGKEIPATDGAPVELELDEASVSFDPTQPNRVVAVIGGRVEWSGSKLSISELLQLEAVSFATGSIEFDGAVHVTGEVCDNFDVWARGSVEIGGWVGACNVTSGAQLTLSQGVNGRDLRGLIQSAGDMWVRSLRSSRLECGKDMVVEKEMLWCDTTVQGNLVVETGRVVGGRHHVGGSVVVHVLGGEGHETTEIHMDSNQERVRRATRRWHQAQDNVQEVLRHHPAIFADDHEPRTEVLRLRLATLREEEARLHEAELRIETEVAEQNRRQGIWVKSAIHPGTEIHFAGSDRVLKVSRRIQGPVKVRLDRDANQIVVDPA